jgi:hypothetical protein
VCLQMQLLQCDPFAVHSVGKQFFHIFNPNRLSSHQFDDSRL